MTDKKKRPRALSLFSGGLDSLLATRLVADLGVDILGLHFTAPFIEPLTRPGKTKQVEAWAQRLGIPLRHVPIEMDFIEVIRNPHYGHGKHLNPCVDCKIYMLRKAAQIMRKEDFDFVITGEVLGQRPMSQRRDAMAAIEKQSGLKGYLLRPLSAQWLDPTIPEQQGLIDRSRLPGLSGRGRSKQLELAAQLGINDPPGSAGGCLLTDAAYSARLRHLMMIKPKPTDADLELLTVGRHLDIEGRGKVIVSRNEAENELIEKLQVAGDLLLEPENWPGPTALLVNAVDDAAIAFAAGCIARYGKPDRKSLVKVINLSENKLFHVSAIAVEDTVIQPRRIDLMNGK